ncbi:hypothetical protein MNV49_007581 [Pseudohyphozyma bogoriensis]|nr:hypothetical protein MNV49_007581 [Pseudohyphozyma bogoriensis]
MPSTDAQSIPLAPFALSRESQDSENKRSFDDDDLDDLELKLGARHRAYEKGDDSDGGSLFDDPDGEDGALGVLLGGATRRSAARRVWSTRLAGLPPSWITTGAASLVVLLSIVGIAIYIITQNYQVPDDPTSKALFIPCRENKWRPGTWVNCTLSMGLNNLRSEFSTCLKFAFDAGAGLILPTIALRNTATLDAWQTEGVQYAGPDIYFDVDYLKEKLAVSCPQMRFKDRGDTTDIAVQVKDKKREWWELRFAAGQYRQHFDEMLSTHDVKQWSANAGVVVEETLRPYAVWDYTSQSVAFGHGWFDIVQFAHRLVSVGDHIASHSALAEGYLGVHLRLEKDAFDYWSGFDAQTNAYAHYIDPRPEKVIYLACGDPSWKTKFQDRFPKHKVVDKWDLLEEGSEAWSNAKNLTFDESAILDYRAMLPANLVMGIGVSSFAYLLGVDRRANREAHYAETLHSELMPPNSPMVGDDNTLLLPFILPEYYQFFP